MRSIERLKAKDCCFCKHYVVKTKDLHGILSEITKRGCDKFKQYVPDFKVRQGLDCFEVKPKHSHLLQSSGGKD